MYLYDVCAWCPLKPEENIESLLAGVKDVCEPLSEC